MPPKAPQPGVIPIPKAIDYYFQLSLYLLVLTGFGTLASTGGLDLPSIVLVGAALALRGYILAERKHFVMPERWTAPLSAAYVLFFAADFLFLSRSFLTATVHLALFAVVVRMFTLRRDRDHVLLAILAFVMVLASAILTVDSVFLFFFAAFMLTAVAAFVLMEMQRSGRTANIQARHSTDPQEHRRLAFALARMAPALMAMILLGAAGVFFLLPRMSAGYMGGYSFGTDLSTGFSDRVQLGQIGQIQQSNAVVMHVQIEGDNLGRYDLHWRGVSLAEFDGHGWSNTRQQLVLDRQPGGAFAIPAFGTRIPPKHTAQSVATPSSPREQLIHYRVLMEPIGTNVFFLAPWAQSVKGDFRNLAVDRGSAVFDQDIQHPITRYEAESDISVPSPDQLRNAGQIYPPQVTPLYLQLPEMLDARIPRLAADITKSASTNYDRAAKIEIYLKTRYAYTLQQTRTAMRDPLANFLFERKQGHCEYFASSMAVMLRTLGIPARVVNGFRSDEFNDLTGNYVVRAKDAHSWVEAYFPAYGWQTFDPTPAGASGTPQGWDRAMLYLDAMSSFWREWVISYDAAHQFSLGHAAVSGTRGVWERGRAWWRQHYAAMLRWARHSQERAEHSPKRWFALGLGAGLVLLALSLVLANLRRIAQWLHEKRLREHPEDAPAQAATMWYERMARSLARRGVQKLTAQTPREFAGIIPEERLRARVQQFTEAYESARFGQSQEDVQRLPELYEEVELATRK
jgi:protein-glutamine gamma-glutamyltransferase